MAGIRTWNKLGRFVNKGEKGIPILAPMIKAQEQRREDSEEQWEKPAHLLIGFRKVWVFDIRQTDGEDLPEIAKVRGDVSGYRERLIQFTEAQGIQLSFPEDLSALGLPRGGEIVLRAGLEPAESFATLVHENAHELLHKRDRRTGTTKVMRETEAEAVAYVVCSFIGLDCGTASADYIHLYDGNADTLLASLELIQKTASTILAAIVSVEPSGGENRRPMMD